MRLERQQGQIISSLLGHDKVFGLFLREMESRWKVFSRGFTRLDFSFKSDSDCSVTLRGARTKAGWPGMRWWLGVANGAGGDGASSWTYNEG